MCSCCCRCCCRAKRPCRFLFILTFKLLFVKVTNHIYARSHSKINLHIRTSLYVQHTTASATRANARVNNDTDKYRPHTHTPSVRVCACLRDSKAERKVGITRNLHGNGLDFVIRPQLVVVHSRECRANDKIPKNTSCTLSRDERDWSDYFAAAAEIQCEFCARFCCV